MKKFKPTLLLIPFLALIFAFFNFNNNETSSSNEVSDTNEVSKNNNENDFVYEHKSKVVESHDGPNSPVYYEFFVYSDYIETTNKSLDVCVGDYVWLGTTTGKNGHEYGFKSCNYTEYGITCNKGSSTTNHCYGYLKKPGTLHFTYEERSVGKTYSHNYGYFTLNVAKKPLVKPTISNCTFTISSSDVIITDFNSDFMEKSGNLRPYSVGTYYTYIKIKDPSVAYWKDDGTTDTLTITWEVKPAKVPKPYIEYGKNHFIYTGRAIEPSVVNRYGGAVRFSSGVQRATEPGHYTMTYVTDSQRCFPDETTSVTLDWYIDEIEVKGGARLKSNEFDINDSGEVGFHWDNTLKTVTWEVENSEDEGKIILDENKTSELSAIDRGKHYVYVKPAPHYAWPGGGTETRALEWSIEFYRYAVPFFTDKNEFTYTGIKIGEYLGWGNVLSEYYSDKMEMEFYKKDGTHLDEEPVDAGEYEIIFSLKDDVYEYNRFFGDPDDGSPTVYVPPGVSFTITKKTFAKFNLDSTYLKYTGSAQTPKVRVDNDTLLSIEDYVDQSSIKPYVDSLKYYKITTSKPDGDLISKEQSVNVGNYKIELSFINSLYEKGDVCWTPIEGKTATFVYSIGPTDLREPLFVNGTKTFTYEYDVNNPNKIFDVPFNDDFNTETMELTYDNKVYTGTKNVEGGVTFKDAYRKQLNINKPQTYHFSINIKKDLWETQCWEGNHHNPIEYDIIVTKDRIVKPGFKNDSFYYTGENIDPVIGFDDNYDSKTIEYFYSPSIEVGNNYKVRFSLKYPSTSCWVESENDSANDNSADYSLNYKIVNGQLAKPQLLKTEYTYNKKSHTLEFKEGFEFNEKYMYIEGLENAIEVGTYNLTVKLKYPDKFEWIGTDKSNPVLSFSITPYLVPVPTLCGESSYIYTGANFVPYVNNYNPDFMTCTMEGNKQAVNVGSYAQIYTLRDSKNTSWDDAGKTKDPKKINFSIDEQEVTRPILTNEYATFTNEPFSPIWEGFNKDIMQVTDFVPQTNVGSGYTFKVKLTNSNYKWADTNSNEITYTYSISQANLVVPTLKETSFTYSGERMEPELNNFVPSLMERIDDDNYEAGEHHVKIKLKNQIYSKWSNNSNGTDVDTIDLTYNINKLRLKKPTIVKNEFEYDGEDKFPNIEGFKKEYMEYQTIPSEADAGIYNLAICLKNSNSMEWTDGSNDPVLFDLVVSKKTITPLTIEKYKYDYTGCQVTPELSKYDPNYINVTMPVSVEPNTYQIVLSLKDTYNTCWSDGTTGDKYIIYKIKSSETNVNNNIIMIVGIIFGSICGAGLIFLIIFLFARRRKNGEISLK